MNGAVSSWTRKHPRVVDAAVAAGVFAYNLPVQGAYVPEGLPPGTGVVISLGLCAPYVGRRDFPRASFGGIVLACLVQLALGIGFLPADVMLYCALYTVAARHERRTSVAAAGLVTLCALLAATRWADEPFLTVGDLLTALVLVVSVWMWGSMIGIRRAYVAGLRERAAQLERERDNQARIAAAAERARIAREIHDIVSHSLSTVVVLAKGASANVHHDPDRAEHAIRNVEGTGRQALSEMRRMLDVLRDDEPGSHSPQPGLAQLEQLITDTRQAGLPVEFTVRGTPRALPDSADLAIYRIVQEALTNTRKHAGPDVTSVEVVLSYREQDVRVRIADDGRGPTTGEGHAPESGHGLLGMRERVVPYGGVLHTSRRTGGGFETVVTLPDGRRP